MLGMSSLGKSGQKLVAQSHRAQMRADTESAYDADAADNMKQLVMGMIAVASVMATLFAAFILSEMHHSLSAMVCNALDFPDLMSFT